MLIEAVLAIPLLAAQPAPGPGLRLDFRGGGVRQLPAGLDGGGSFSVNRLSVEPGLDVIVKPEISVSVSVGFSLDDYRFSGASSLGPADPWDDVRTLRVGALLRWRLAERWTVFAAPTIRWAAENGADFGDSVHGGGLLGFSWRVDDRLTIGPGIGAMTQIEDDTSVFPVLLIDWKITESLSLETGRGLGATQGPGLVLRWAFADGWELGVGGRYESQRFRLSSSGPVPGGVGEATSVPIYGAITWEPSPNFRLSLLGGVSLAGELELDAPNGIGLSSADYDPAGFVGLALRARF